MAALTTLDSLLALNKTLDNKQLVVLHLFAPWSEPCKHMDSILEELARIHSNISFVRIDAEDVVDVSEKYQIISVPCFLFFKDAKEVDRLSGASADILTAKVGALARGGATPTTTAPAAATAAPSLCAINKRCEQLVKSSHVMLFMKGCPDAPRCGFSRRVVEALHEAGCKDFGYFDILTDEDVRAGIKQYSNWPTYPQLYVDGELLGGCDIVQELKDAGELAQELGVKKQEDINTRLKSLIASKPVMLFMKGVPDEPRCGFSRQVVQALRDADVEFGSFDILSDDDVRAGLKTYSDWPTYPQLYAGSQLVGGCDIVQELAQAGELASTLQEMVQDSA